MGDPKKIRKKYSTPSHPWQKARIEEEIGLKREYGLRNKQQIWVMVSMIKSFSDQFKKLNALRGSQAEKEKSQLKSRLESLGLLTKEQPLDSVLALETKDLMERRLQTLVFRKNLARTIKQARQFIVHRHITVNGIKVTSPSYLVKLSEEGSIGFVQTSDLADPNHPERYEEMPKDKEVKKKGVKKKDEEEVVAFDEVPKDEEAIVKEIKPKKAKEVKNETSEETKDTESKELKESKEPRTESEKPADKIETQNTESKDDDSQVKSSPQPGVENKEEVEDKK